MRTVRAGLALLIGCGALIMATAAPAGAANATGCSGAGTSIGASGFVIDRASAPGAGGTESHPFQVETDGRVRYRYQVNAPISRGTYTVQINSLFGPIDLPSGKIKSGSQQSGTGVEPLKKHLQIGGLAALVGSIKVKIVVKSPSGRTVCVVSGWIKINDSPVKSVIFWESVLMFFLAMIFLWLAMVTGAPGVSAEITDPLLAASTGEPLSGSSE